jgi:hypothetical protein
VSRNLCNRNSEVFESWYKGTSGENNTKTLFTDGRQLYSYETIIGFTNPTGQKTALKFRWKGYRHINSFTKKHVNELFGFLDIRSLNYASLYAADFKHMCKMPALPKLET